METIRTFFRDYVAWLSMPSINVIDIIEIIIIAFAVFCLIKGINSMHRKKEEAPKEEPAPPEPSNEEKLLTEIRDLLKEKRW